MTLTDLDEVMDRNIIDCIVFAHNDHTTKRKDPENEKTKKTLIMASIVLLTLTACTNSNEAPQEPVNETADSQTETTNSQVETSTELIPMDELDILKNEPKLYEGRPFADVPVEVISVERYSDRVVIEASRPMRGSGHYFTLVQDGSETDIQPQDALYIDGVVRNDIDTKKLFPSAATKVELSGYQKVKFADLLDPVVTSKPINLTLENDLFSATIEKADVGDQFTRIYYTPTPKDKENFSGNIEAVIMTSEGELEPLKTSDAIKISVAGSSVDDNRYVFVFDKIDIDNDFTLKLTGFPFTLYSKDDLVPLVFEIR